MVNKILRAGLIACTCALVFPSCVITQVASLEKISSEVLPVYSLSKPERPFTEIRYLEADGSIFHRNRKLLLHMAQKAKKEGADAVINVQFKYIGLAPYCTGVAIKYK